jgi:hypothetical protein
MTCIGFGDSNASEVVMEVSLTGDNLSEWRGPWPNLHMAQAGNWHIDNDPLWSRLTGYDDTIDCNQIDNEHCIYWVYVRMHQFSSAKESLVGVRIDYEIPY